jgi:hypothetical protein
MVGTYNTYAGKVNRYNILVGTGEEKRPLKDIGNDGKNTLQKYGSIVALLKRVNKNTQIR